MQRTKIDIENWERKETYNFFKDFANPTVAITSEIECQKAYDFAKRNKKSFFLIYSYALLKATNDITEFRYRVEDSADQVYCYDRIDLTTPIKVNDNGKYIQRVFEYIPDFEKFHTQTQAQIKEVNEQMEVFCEDSVQTALVGISAVPELSFTAISYTLRYANGLNFLPLITVGKMVERDNKKVIPISISIHHGFVDGHHVTEFFKSVQQTLNSF